MARFFDMEGPRQVNPQWEGFTENMLEFKEVVLIQENEQGVECEVPASSEDLLYEAWKERQLERVEEAAEIRGTRPWTGW